MILGGYGQLANGLASSPTILDIRYNHGVKQIKYVEQQNRRIAEDESIQADAVVLTVPLGVLKSGRITFEPELPAQKTDAISRLGFGLLNKVLFNTFKLTAGCTGV